MSVITALRITYSIPFLFTPVIHDDNYYIDGAVTDNYAIQLFENNNKKTMGVVLISKDIYKCQIDNLENYLLSVVWTSFAHQLKDKIEKYTDITIDIESNLDSFNFSLDQSHRLELINIGYDTCRTKIKEKFTFLL